MKYIAYALIPLSVSFISPLIFGLVRKENLRKEKKMTKSEFVITNSFGLAFIALIFAIVFSIFLIVINIQEKLELVQNLLAIPCLIAVIIGCYALIREIKIIKGDSIKFVPAFGKTKYYSFKDIKEVEVVISSTITSYKIIGEKGKKLFFINDLNAGGKFFLEKLKGMRIPFNEKFK